MPHTHYSLLRCHRNGHVILKRLVGLDYPNAIIGVSLTTKAKDLKRRRGVNSHSGAGRHAGNLLNTAAQERIA